MCVFVFACIKLRITAQSDSVLLVILGVCMLVCSRFGVLICLLRSYLLGLKTRVEAHRGQRKERKMEAASAACSPATSRVARPSKESQQRHS